MKTLIGVACSLALLLLAGCGTEGYYGYGVSPYSDLTEPYYYNYPFSQEPYYYQEPYTFYNYYSVPYANPYYQYHYYTAPTIPPTVPRPPVRSQRGFEQRGHYEPHGGGSYQPGTVPPSGGGHGRH